MVDLIDMEGNEYKKKVKEVGALQKTKDLFCFCCFTSLRYSDMASLKRTDIEGNKMHIVTQKTNDRITIDLNSYAMAILDKYKDETFPKYELIGTHAGRRTFICFALSQGIPPQVVMKWTGHSDYKAMKPYIDIAEKTKAEAMNLFEMGLKKE